MNPTSPVGQSNESDAPPVITQPTYFARVPHWLIFHPDLSDGAKLCYAVLASHADRLGQLWPSQETLAEEMGRTARSVRSYMTELRDLGILRESKRRWNSSTVWVLEYEQPEKNFQPELLDRKDSSALDRKDSSGKSGKILPPNKNQELDPKNKNHSLAVPAKKRDELFESIAVACGIDWQRLTPSARGQLNRATKEIREAEGTPEDVPMRSFNFKARYPDLVLTPSALAKHWPALGETTRAQQPINKSRALLAQRRINRGS